MLFLNIYNKQADDMVRVKSAGRGCNANKPDYKLQEKVS